MKQTVPLNTKVVFKWKGYHNVYALPDKKAFDACDFSKATKLASHDQGPYTYKASSAGIVYFACEVGGHCSFNQKLALTVTGNVLGTCYGFVKFSFIHISHKSLARHCLTFLPALLHRRTHMDEGRLQRPVRRGRWRGLPEPVAGQSLRPRHVPEVMRG